MTFTVTYRDKTGAKREEALEAASRAECVAACRKRGISPLSIREGGHAGRVPLPGGRTTGTKGAKGLKGDSRGRQVLAILGTLVILAILGGGAWWWLGRTEGGKSRIENEGGPSAVPAVPKAVRDVTPAKPTRQPKPAATNALVPKAVAPSAAGRPDGLKRAVTGDLYVSSTAVTNEDGSVIERLLLPNGRYKRIYHMVTAESRVFHHDTDEILYQIASTPPGQEIPPYPDLGGDLDEKFLESLKTPVKITDKDDERRAEMKRKVAAMREEVLKLMDEGYSVRRIIDEHRTLQNENIELRASYQKELNRLYYEQKDIEGATEYFKAMNKGLEEMGVLPLQMPGTGEKKKKARRQE